MFDFVRTHQRLMQFILLLVILPPFVLGGGSFIYSKFANDDAVAIIGKQSISTQEFEQRLRQLDPRLLERPDTKQRVLDDMIAERVVLEEATRGHLNASNDQIRDYLYSQAPELADPKLSAKEKQQRLEAFAMSVGTSSTMLPSLIGKQVTRQNVVMGLVESGFASKTAAEQYVSFLQQERDVQPFVFKSSDYASAVKVTDDMLKAYYDQHIKQFEVPEHVKLEYVVYSPDAISEQLTATEDDVKKYYEENKSKEMFAIKPQWHAAHILVGVTKTATEDQKKAAKAKAEQLLAEVRKTPGDFAKIAKANSDDKGSGERGGDLGFFGDHDMVPQFQEAVAKLKTGEISDLVLSDYGYHIIQLIEAKPAGVKSLEEARGEIVNAWKKDLSTKRFTEGLETFKNTVYEQADSLQPAVEKLSDKVKLKIVSADNIAREPAAGALPNSPLANAEFLKAVFADDAIKSKHNTAAVEVGPNTFASGRVVEYVAATKKPLDQVKDEVSKAVLQEETTKLAKKAGEEKLAALKAKDDASGFGTLQTISRTNPGNIDPKVAEAVLKADGSKLPAYIGVELPNQGYGVYRISRVGQPAKLSDSDAALRAQISQRMSGMMANQEYYLYIESLKQKYKVKVVRPELLVASGKDKPETK